MHPPDTVFTQSVHLISRPEFPKLRLRFTYHNPQLQAQLQAQREAQHQETRWHMALTQQVDRAQFEEVQKLTRIMKEQEKLSERSLIGSVPQAVDPSSDAWTGAFPSDRSEAERLRDALMSALGFISDVRHVLATHNAQCASSQAAGALPPHIDRAELLSSGAPAPYVDDHCSQLLNCLQQTLAVAKAGTAPVADIEAEQLVEEGLKLLSQQRQAMQLSFDAETSALRRQLEDM